MAYASRLVKHSNACSPTVYGTNVCPIPYGKLTQCAQNMYWSEQGLYKMKTQKEVRHNSATGTLMLVLAIMLLLGALGELRAHNNYYQYLHCDDNNV
jgi:hypothetical protein